MADDHPPTRAGIRLTLEGHGFLICAECASAPAAVAAAERHRPDLCLLDVRMPGNGVAAAAEIASRVPGSVIVMLTVSRDDGDLFEALRVGASGYLLKDVDPSRLVSTLKEVLAGEAALDHRLVTRLVDEVRERSRRRHALLKRSGVELTAREREVLELLGERLSTAQIAERLSIAPVTVRRHISRLLRELKVRDREAAVRLLDDG